jgi:hypothetical protein
MMNRLSLRYVMIAVMMLLVLSGLLFYYLRDLAIQKSFSANIVGIEVAGSTIHVRYEVCYDTAGSVWRKWLAPQSVFLDRGLLSSSVISGQRVEWLLADGRIVPAGKWMLGAEIRPGVDTAVIRSGDKISATIEAYPGSERNVEAQWRVATRIFYYRNVGTLSFSRPVFTKLIHGKLFEAVEVREVSPWVSWGEAHSEATRSENTPAANRMTNKGSDKKEQNRLPPSDGGREKEKRSTRGRS